jgi:hypothetical protein
MRLSRKCIPVVERVCFIDFFNYTYSESLEYLVGPTSQKVKNIRRTTINEILYFLIFLFHTITSSSRHFSLTEVDHKL